jgi:hypothetical protein
MVIVARARHLAPSEADTLEPLAKEIVRSMHSDWDFLEDEPLALWFGDRTAAAIRSIENAIRHHLVGALTITPSGTHLEHISALAATFYVALFTLCRELASRFRSSNPTWLRQPRNGEARVGISKEVICSRFVDNLRSMAVTLASRADLFSAEQAKSEIRLADSTTMPVAPGSTDFVLTSPPYCTRIDYTAATRVELALLTPLIRLSPKELGRQMIGSTRVPAHEVEVSQSWGLRCARFLDELKRHPSKASDGYYYRTHVDYFDKISRSLDKIALGLKPNGLAVFVVQDSYYKDLHNDLPAILADIAEVRGLRLRRREDFPLVRSMSGINPYTRIYNRAPTALEAVLCFQKQ